MKKLVLFDIDGTLILCGPAPRKAITDALQAVYGTTGGIQKYSFSGKTDAQIVFEVMTAERLPESAVHAGIPAVLERYVQQLGATLRGGDIRVLPGVPALLERLAQHPDVVLGLLTGNVQPGARIKLERAGLDHYFFNGGHALGAFGSDAMDRKDLPALALRRAKELGHPEFQGKNIVIVGDSPSDVLCGRDLDVMTVAVATGWHARSELIPYVPDHLFDDFTDTTRVVQTITGAG